MGSHSKRDDARVLIVLTGNAATANRQHVGHELPPHVAMCVHCHTQIGGRRRLRKALVQIALKSGVTFV